MVTQENWERLFTFKFNLKPGKRKSTDGEFKNFLKRSFGTVDQLQFSYRQRDNGTFALSGHALFLHRTPIPNKLYNTGAHDIRFYKIPSKDVAMRILKSASAETKETESRSSIGSETGPPPSTSSSVLPGSIVASDSLRATADKGSEGSSSSSEDLTSVTGSDVSPTAPSTPPSPVLSHPAADARSAAADMRSAAADASTAAADARTAAADARTAAADLRFAAADAKTAAADLRSAAADARTAAPDTRTANLTSATGSNALPTSSVQSHPAPSSILSEPAFSNAHQSTKVSASVPSKPASSTAPSRPVSSNTSALSAAPSKPASSLATSNRVLSTVSLPAPSADATSAAADARTADLTLTKGSDTSQRSTTPLKPPSLEAKRIDSPSSTGSESGTPSSTSSSVLPGSIVASDSLRATAYKASAGSSSSSEDLTSVTGSDVSPTAPSTPPSPVLSHPGADARSAEANVRSVDPTPARGSDAAERSATPLKPPSTEAERIDSRSSIGSDYGAPAASSSSALATSAVASDSLCAEADAISADLTSTTRSHGRKGFATPLKPPSPKTREVDSDCFICSETDARSTASSESSADLPTATGLDLVQRSATRCNFSSGAANPATSSRPTDNATCSSVAVNSRNDIDVINLSDDDSELENGYSITDIPAIAYLMKLFAAIDDAENDSTFTFVPPACMGLPLTVTTSTTPFGFKYPTSASEASLQADKTSSKTVPTKPKADSASVASEPKKKAARKTAPTKSKAGSASVATEPKKKATRSKSLPSKSVESSSAAPSRRTSSSVTASKSSKRAPSSATNISKTLNRVTSEAVVPAATKPKARKRAAPCAKSPARPKRRAVGADHVRVPGFWKERVDELDKFEKQNEPNILDPAPSSCRRSTRQLEKRPASYAELSETEVE